MGQWSRKKIRAHKEFNIFSQWLAWYLLGKKRRKGGGQKTGRGYAKRYIPLVLARGRERLREMRLAWSAKGFRAARAT